MKKVAFIGAGSFGFTRTLVRDILTFPAFRDCHIALMDIDDRRLEYIERAIKKIVAAGGYPAKVTATKSRAEALEGADGVPADAEALGQALAYLYAVGSLAAAQVLRVGVDRDELDETDIGVHHAVDGVAAAAADAYHLYGRFSVLEFVIVAYPVLGHNHAACAA